MAQEVLMPKLGLTMTEGTIGEWKIQEGQRVKQGEILFSVETDKLTNDVEAVNDGVLLKILLPAGETAPCKAVIAYIGEVGEAIPAAASAAAPISEAAPAAQVASASPVPAREPGSPIIASPAAKKLAREKGIALDGIVGTGPQGRITVEDVEAYAAAPTPTEAKATPTAALLAKELGVDLAKLGVVGRARVNDVLKSALAGDAAGGLEERTVPFSGMRKTIARRMSESWATSPRVWYEAEVDATNMKALRSQLKDSFKAKGLKLTYNHILMLAVTQALRAFPEINGSVEGDSLVLHPSVNLGLAVSVPDGLLVPNIKGCEWMGLEQICIACEDAIERAREGKLTGEDLTGGTFTITNIGMYGTLAFAPIINQPELAILGVAAIKDIPVAVKGEVQIRPIMRLNLVADHRVVDGAMGAQFLERIVQLLETPAMMLM